MKYSFTCAPDGVVLSTEAKTDEEALTKLVELGKKHMKEFHKGQAPVSDAESKKMIQSVWKKG
ncbi:MAG: hypothetical protein ABSG19_12090 [Candidatus Aminicenantales bacterium]